MYKKILLSVLLLNLVSFSAHAAESSEPMDPNELKAQMQNYLRQIYGLAEKSPQNRQLYSELMVNGAFMMHKLKKGYVEQPIVQKEVEKLGKMLADNDLTTKEATEWLQAVKPLATVSRPAAKQPELVITPPPQQ